MNPSREDRLAGAALVAVTWVSDRRLKGAADGEKVCIPAQVMRDVAAALEADYPGMIADWRRRHPVSTSKLGTYPSRVP